MKTITLQLPDNLNLSEEDIRQLLAAKLVETGQISPEQAVQWPATEAASLANHPMTEAEAAEIKHLIGLYYAEKATAAMDALWEKNGWTAETMEQWLTEKMRSSDRKAS
ncbi:MAG TPA: hypothetical protein VF598_09620 [Hymenobacter sp.]|jgi:hypothetical protein